MENNKIDILRNKIKGKDFENKFKSIDKWLFNLSFVGNIGSIFFAFFFIFPIFKFASSLFINNEIFGNILSSIVTTGLLITFEIIKRKILKTFFFDIVKEKYNILKFNVFSWLLVSLILIAGSFYFSLNGSIDLISTSNEKNFVIEKDLSLKKDSIIHIYNDKISFLEQDNKILSQNNNQLRLKLIETPLNYRTVRKEYQNFIDANIENIENNNLKIEELKKEKQQEINNLKKELENEKEKNKNTDKSNIFFFLLISTTIELLIILGLYFRQYYDIKVYRLNEEKHNKIYKKRERYIKLIRFLYKDGNVNTGDKVIGVSKVKELLKNKSKIVNINSFTTEFFDDMEQFNIIKTVGKRRYFNMNMEDAVSIINKMDDSTRILEELD